MMSINTTTVEPRNVEKSNQPKSARNRDPLANITNASKKPAELKQLSNQFDKDCKISKQKSDSTDDSSIVPHEDIDKNDFNDPQAVAEYVNPIYEYLMLKEKDRVDFTYMINQKHITEKMRAILVDWLVEVHRMFKLLPETLFLSVAMIDRYLSMKQISQDMLQLVGITSMLIASKYEEIYAPECNDFVYISDGAYTKQQILHMEQTILNTLNFNITHPSALHFLRRYSKAGGSDYTLHTVCKYLIELVLIDVKFLKYLPSLLAAASVYLGRAMTGKTPLWTSTLHFYTTYSESVVRECALEMNELLKKSHSSSLKAIRKKYSSPKFGQVAELSLIDL
jgi:cyclin B